MNKRLLTLAIIAGIATGCASKPEKIAATYVSPLEYKDYDCEQIGLEMGHVATRTTELHNSLTTEANNDAAQMGIGLVLFWPALFLLEGGDGPEAAEYANLKGKYTALHDAAMSKKCDMASLPPSPEQQLQAQAEKEREQQQDMKNNPVF